MERQENYDYERDILLDERRSRHRHLLLPERARYGRHHYARRFLLPCGVDGHQHGRLKEKRRMTQEMKELIDRELDDALESGDAKLIDRAIIN